MIVSGAPRGPAAGPGEVNSPPGRAVEDPAARTAAGFRPISYGPAGARERRDHAPAAISGANGSGRVGEGENGYAWRHTVPRCPTPGR
ncbi:hypothetical protein EBF04_04190 [Streptomyces sp. I6]|nr:hypothetical protein EBF04_04190 [Streptomyces sp. I6]